MLYDINTNLTAACALGCYTASLVTKRPEVLGRVESRRRKGGKGTGYDLSAQAGKAYKGQEGQYAKHEENVLGTKSRKQREPGPSHHVRRKAKKLDSDWQARNCCHTVLIGKEQEGYCLLQINRILPASSTSVVPPPKFGGGIIMICYLNSK